jgi:DNA-binding NarL/FixJ family response regulator
MTEPTVRHSIVIVDDHPIVRDHLRHLLEYEPDLAVCAEAADAPEAIARHQPALVIADLGLKNSPGLELIKDLAAYYPQTRILVYSMHPESLWAERVLHAGALGYIMKDELTSQVLVAIRRVLSGQVYVSQRMAAQLLNKFSPHTTPGNPLLKEAAQLSDREMEVLELIGAGYGPGEMAEILHLDVKTIESYRTRIRHKLQLPDAAELRRRAIAWAHHLDGL